MKPATKDFLLSISLATCVLLVVMVVIANRRIDKLAEQVAAREQVDPLIPPECADPSRVCVVTLTRLLFAPQQFVGREVDVRGRYESGFETSALIASEEAATTAIASQALWIYPGLPAACNGKTVQVRGLFHRAPAGHLDSYSGALNDARLILGPDGLPSCNGIQTLPPANKGDQDVQKIVP